MVVGERRPEDASRSLLASSSHASARREGADAAGAVGGAFFLRFTPLALVLVLGAALSIVVMGREEMTRIRSEGEGEDEGGG